VTFLDYTRCYSIPSRVPEERFGSFSLMLPLHSDEKVTQRSTEWPGPTDTIFMKAAVCVSRIESLFADIIATSIFFIRHERPENVPRHSRVSPMTEKPLVSISVRLK